MIASIALGFAGLVLIGIALFLWSRTREFVASARSTKGTVVRLVSDSEGAVAPVFKFTGTNGEVIEKQDGMYSSPSLYQEDSPVDNLYDPDNPRNARIARTSDLYFAPILLAVLGILFFAFATVGLGLRLLDMIF